MAWNMRRNQKLVNSGVLFGPTSLSFQKHLICNFQVPDYFDSTKKVETIDNKKICMHHSDSLASYNLWDFEFLKKLKN